MRALLSVLALAASLLVAVPAQAAPARPLTNLAHLDFLTDTVRPPAQAGHTTYRPDRPLRQVWVYAEKRDDGYERVGGGTYHPDTDTYDQGAYDTDDIARAAVVYLRHWRQFGDAHSRTYAFDLLRGLTYMQTTRGRDRGNVVLWMQPDGTLTPSAIPREEPDPSDSANSYWLARTVWALGEGYAAYRDADPSFARFLRDRMRLALGALQRETLARYGTYHRVDGARTPAWLIVDGADATAEAVLGLSAFVQAGGREGRTPLRQFAEGIAALGSRPGGTWPYGAALPSALSRSSWHAWAGLAPAALADASVALHTPRLARPAAADSGAFSAGLLATVGPANGLTPAPVDTSSIAYGVDSRLQSALATADATGSARLRTLAGVWGGWYFGQNPAGAPAYDPATGVTVDGIAADGTVNRNSGAESTIHGLLSMLALDAHPRVAAVARAADELVSRGTPAVVEAESATTTGDARTVDAPAPSAESSASGGELLRVTGTATATWRVTPSGRPRVIEVVTDVRPGRGSDAVISADGRRLGRVTSGGGAPQGDSPVPGRLTPVRVGILPAGASTVTARFTGGSGSFDALVLTPRRAVLDAGGATVVSDRLTGRFTVTLG
ncbi:DUF5585 domain-containing protein [Jatrophihabitans fulvus]